MELEVVHTMPFDIAAIVEEISTRIHSPKPIAMEMPPAESKGMGIVTAAMAEEDSELIEWDVIESSSPETPVTDQAVEETPSDFARQFRNPPRAFAEDLPTEESAIAAD